MIPLSQLTGRRMFGAMPKLIKSEITGMIGSAVTQAASIHSTYFGVSTTNRVWKGRSSKDLRGSGGKR